MILFCFEGETDPEKLSNMPVVTQLMKVLELGLNTNKSIVRDKVLGTNLYCLLKVKVKF